MSNPLVSVILPVYNCGPYIAEAVESIINQSLKNFELLIIDDSSTDDTIEIINTYKDSRIRLIRKEENTGLISSLNIGLQIAKGSYIARMDGDDISYPDRLEKQVNFLNYNPTIALCGTWYQLIPTEGVVENPTNNEEIKIALINYCALGHPTVMLRKNFIDEHQLIYDMAFTAAEDYDLWTRVIACGQIANIPEVLLKYRCHSNQITATNQSEQVQNSILCRIRMLCYPIPSPSLYDYSIAKNVVQNVPVESTQLLKETLFWLNELIASNKKTGFYLDGLFNENITQKKSVLIRRYYFNTTAYNPSVLVESISLINQISPFFKFKEAIAFTAKCLLFWGKKPSRAK